MGICSVYLTVAFPYFFQDCFQNIIATCHESEEEEIKGSCIATLCKYIITSSSNPMKWNLLEKPMTLFIGCERELYAVLFLVS